MQSVDVFHVENDVYAAYYIFHRSLVQYLMIPFIITLLHDVFHWSQMSYYVECNSWIRFQTYIGTLLLQARAYSLVKLTYLILPRKTNLVYCFGCELEQADYRVQCHWKLTYNHRDFLIVFKFIYLSIKIDKLLFIWYTCSIAMIVKWCFIGNV